jgi:hypothetical protein
VHRTHQQYEEAAKIWVTTYGGNLLRNPIAKGARRYNDAHQQDEEKHLFHVGP